MENLRQILNSYENELYQGNIEPLRAGEILKDISSLYSNILENVKKRQIEYNKVLLFIFDEEKKASRARLRGEVLPEYERLLSAKNMERSALELMRALKYFLRTKETEYREMAGNQ